MNTSLLYPPPICVQVWTLEDSVLEGGGGEVVGGDERTKLIDESDEGT